MEILVRLGVVVLGLLILLVSMARAGLEIWATEEKETIILNKTINFIAKFGDGETMVGVYQVPETGMLPDNLFYGVKKIRDFLWLELSMGENKIKMAVLQADKGVAATAELIKKEDYSRAVESGNEAMDKLEYANKLLNDIKVTDDQTKQLHYQIFRAGFAYKEVFKRLDGAFGMDNSKYLNLLNRINDWNKEQENNRYDWDH